MVTFKWDFDSKITSEGGILTGGFWLGDFEREILTELESNFYVNKVLLDADYDKLNTNFLRPTFKSVFGLIRDL